MACPIDSSPWARRSYVKAKDVRPVAKSRWMVRKMERARCRFWARRASRRHFPSWSRRSTSRRPALPRVGIAQRQRQHPARPYGSHGMTESARPNARDPSKPRPQSGHTGMTKRGGSERRSGNSTVARAACSVGSAAVDSPRLPAAWVTGPVHHSGEQPAPYSIRGRSPGPGCPGLEAATGAVRNSLPLRFLAPLEMTFGDSNDLRKDQSGSRPAPRGPRTDDLSTLRT